MALFFTRRACSVIRASSFLGWGHGYNYPGRRRLIHPSAWRDCPKSLRRTFNIALRATKEGVLVHFALRIPAKSTLGALLIPLFGQSQKGNSPKFASGLGERHHALKIANRGRLV